MTPPTRIRPLLTAPLLALAVLLGLPGLLPAQGTGCIDPLDLPDYPEFPPRLRDSECPPCQDLVVAYLYLRWDHLQSLNSFSRQRVEARELHATVDATCRELRALELDGIPIPDDRRQSLREQIEALADKVEATRELTRDMQAQLEDLLAKRAEAIECDEQYCGKVFQEPGSGGRVSSPSPIVLEDFEPVELHPPIDSGCPACAEVVGRLNAALREANEMARELNERIGELNAVKTEIAELRRTTTEVTDRESALFERGVDLVDAISAAMSELTRRRNENVLLMVESLDCELEHCPPIVEEPVEWTPGLLEVQGEGTGLFTPGGVEGVGTDGAGGISVDLAVSKTGPAEAVVGSEITYVVEVVNLGLDAADFGLRDPIPEGADFVLVTPADGCSVTGRTLDCSGRLEPGERREYLIQVRVVEGADTLRNIAAVTAVGVTDSDPSNNSSDVVVTRIVAEPAEADLSVSMSGPGTAAPGDPVRYDVRVENLGPDEASGVKVEITVPAGIEVTEVGAGCTHSGTTVTCDLGDLAAGADGSTIVEGTVASGASGTLIVEATVSSDTHDPNPNNDQDQQRTRVEPDEPEPTGCAALSGTFTGTGGCGINGPLEASNINGTLVLNPFGANGPTRFDISGDSATSESDELVIFGQGGHECTLSCQSAEQFTLRCEIPGTESDCEEVFSEQ